MPAAFPAPSKIKGPSEIRTYLFDFSNFPEVAGGGTLSFPTAPAVAGLTFGTATITTADDDDVDAGKGVWLRVSGGTADTDYTIAVRVTVTDVNGNTSAPEVRLNLKVR